MVLQAEDDKLAGCRRHVVEHHQAVVCLQVHLHVKDHGEEEEDDEGGAADKEDVVDDDDKVEEVIRGQI